MGQCAAIKPCKRRSASQARCDQTSDRDARGEQFGQFILQAPQLLERNASAGQPRGLGFEERADLVDLLDFARAKGRDDRAAVGPQFHQPDGGEFLQGLAHGRPADVEQPGEIFLAQTIARFPLTAKNAEKQAPDEIRFENGFDRRGGVWPRVE